MLQRILKCGYSGGFTHIIVITLRVLKFSQVQIGLAPSFILLLSRHQPVSKKDNRGVGSRVAGGAITPPISLDMRKKVAFSTPSISRL